MMGSVDWLERLSPETLAAIQKDLEADGGAGRASPSASSPSEGIRLADGRMVPGTYQEIYERIGTQDDASSNPIPGAAFTFGHIRRKVPIWNNVCSLRDLPEHTHAPTCGSMTFVDETDRDYYLGKMRNGMPGGITPGTFTEILPQGTTSHLQEM